MTDPAEFLRSGGNAMALEPDILTVVNMVLCAAVEHVDKIMEWGLVPKGAQDDVWFKSDVALVCAVGQLTAVLPDGVLVELPTKQ